MHHGARHEGISSFNRAPAFLYDLYQKYFVAQGKLFRPGFPGSTQSHRDLLGSPILPTVNKVVARL